MGATSCFKSSSFSASAPRGPKSSSHHMWKFILYVHPYVCPYVRTYVRPYIRIYVRAPLPGFRGSDGVSLNQLHMRVDQSQNSLQSPCYLGWRCNTVGIASHQQKSAQFRIKIQNPPAEIQMQNPAEIQMQKQGSRCVNPDADADQNRGRCRCKSKRLQVQM
jgi:hypothetical protein